MSGSSDRLHVRSLTLPELTTTSDCKKRSPKRLMFLRNISRRIRTTDPGLRRPPFPVPGRPKPIPRMSRTDLPRFIPRDVFTITSHSYGRLFLPFTMMSFSRFCSKSGSVAPAAEDVGGGAASGADSNVSRARICPFNSLFLYEDSVS